MWRRAASGGAIGGAVVMACVAAGLMGCRDAGRAGANANADADANANANASASASANANANASASANANANANAAGLALCRVMASEGGPAADADATAWLDVAARASFTVRTIETGRELRFEGPGRVRACAGDVALVGEGSAVGLPGSGEAPGAEQWVATACGVARWASGVHRFVGARDACKLQSSMGTANLYLAADVVADALAIDGGAPDAPAPAPAVDAGRDASPWRRIDAKHAFRLHAHGPLDTPAAVKVALGSCERSALSVQTLAARMTSPDAGTNVGELAAESVTARGVARAACAVAAVRVALAGAKAEDQARLDAASARWRTPR